MISAWGPGARLRLACPHAALSARRGLAFREWGKVTGRVLRRCFCRRASFAAALFLPLRSSCRCALLVVALLPPPYLRPLRPNPLLPLLSPSHEYYDPR